MGTMVKVRVGLRGGAALPGGGLVRVQAALEAERPGSDDGEDRTTGRRRSSSLTGPSRSSSAAGLRRWSRCATQGWRPYSRRVGRPDFERVRAVRRERPPSASCSSADGAGLGKIQAHSKLDPGSEENTERRGTVPLVSPDGPESIVVWSRSCPPSRCSTRVASSSHRIGHPDVERVGTVEEVRVRAAGGATPATRRPGASPDGTRRSRATRGGERERRLRSLVVPVGPESIVVWGGSRPPSRCERSGSGQVPRGIDRARGRCNSVERFESALGSRSLPLSGVKAALEAGAEQRESGEEKVKLTLRPLTEKPSSEVVGAVTSVSSNRSTRLFLVHHVDLAAGGDGDPGRKVELAGPASHGPPLRDEGADQAELLDPLFVASTTTTLSRGRSRCRAERSR